MTPSDVLTESTSQLPHLNACDPIMSDPPPPYPSPGRRSRTNRSTRGRHAHRITVSSIHVVPPDSSLEQDAPISPNPFPTTPGGYGDDDAEPTETTPFLAPPSPHQHHSRRPRSLSHISTISATPSLAQTVFSLFQPEDETHHASERQPFLSMNEQEDVPPGHSRSRKRGFFSKESWRWYFKPLAKKVYYMPLLHLTLINFPYALLAWVFLFVFTLSGTTLLMALPLGAVLCFLNLLGARAFARGELALQMRFHKGLAYALPQPPRPIFTRFREPTPAEVEAGRTGPIPERSFYKNTYAMFSDPTSYQALFYFLVIKPAITLLITLALIIFILPALCLIITAPPALRVVRGLGIWQANVAVEGLYLAVR